MSHGEHRSDRLDPDLHAFLERLGGHARQTLTPTIRKWRETGGLLKASARGVALQFPWEGRTISVIWLYGPDRNHRFPRLEIPLSSLAHHLPKDLIAEFRDDLSTVRGIDLEAAGRGATITVDDSFTDADADRILAIARDLARRL